MSYQWIDLGNGRQVYRRVPEPIKTRSDFACPYVASDEMPSGVHPFDGKEYTSKSGWRRANRAGGYIEVGNDSQRFKTPQKSKPDRKAIRQSLEKAAAQLA